MPRHKSPLPAALFLVVLMVLVFMVGCTAPDQPSPNASRWKWAPPTCPCKI